jgi:hypothetical protein
MAEGTAKTEKAQAEPYAVQFSIFLANRVGRLRELLAALAKRGVWLYGFSIVDSSEWAVVRAICSDPDKTRALLKAQGAGFTEKEVMLVELPDAGSLFRACGLLIRAELNISFAYPLLSRTHGHAVLVLRVDDQPLAVQLLSRHGFVILGADDLAGPA